MFKNNLKIAFRSLLRRRTFTAINITGLALGMAAAIFAFLWVQNEMSFDSYHQNADNIYRVNTDIKITNGDTWYWAMTPLPLVDAMKAEIPEIKHTAVLYENRFRPFTLKNGNKTLHGKRYNYVSEKWFEMFDHQFLIGSATGFHNKLQNAIITRSFSERLFGSIESEGLSFLLNEEEFTVQAVIENLPANSSFFYELILPLNHFLSNPNDKADSESWSNYNFLSFVELNEESDTEVVGTKITGLVHQHSEDNNETISIQPLTDIHFDESRMSTATLKGNKQMTYVIAIFGFIALFLACVNYVSLTTAQAGMRTKEVGVRKIIGAKGSHIFRLLFSESLITSLVSLVLALSLVQLTLPLFNEFVEKNFVLSPANSGIWAVVGGTLIGTLLLSGIYPSLFLTGFSPNNFLQGKNFLKMKNTTFRKGLVVMQFAMTIALIIGAFVLFQQQNFINKKDLGYNKSHVFEFQVPYTKERESVVKTIRQSLEESPAILGTAATNSSIINMGSTHSGSLDWNGKPADFVPTVSQYSVGDNFGEVMQLSLADGRWFLPNNQADAKNVLVNETAVRKFDLPKPVVGQTFHFHGVERKIIGVVKDFHYRSLRESIDPLVMWNQTISQGNIIVRTSEGQVKAALAAANQAWKTHNIKQPFEYRFLEETFDQLYKSDAKNASLFQLLAGLAIFISCLGLFGLAVFSTEQRTKEIGIRKVLGASVINIIGLLSKDFLKLIFVALLIAFPLAYYFMEEWLANFAYRIEMPIWVFLIAGILTIALALLTVGAQSLRAATANPVKSLKSD